MAVYLALLVLTCLNIITAANPASSCCELSAREIMYRLTSAPSGRAGEDTTSRDRIELVSMCGECVGTKCRVERYCLSYSQFLSSRGYQDLCKESFDAPWPLSILKIDKKCTDLDIHKAEGQISERIVATTHQEREMTTLQKYSYPRLQSPAAPTRTLTIPKRLTSAHTKAPLYASTRRKLSPRHSPLSYSTSQVLSSPTANPSPFSSQRAVPDGEESTDPFPSPIIDALESNHRSKDKQEQFHSDEQEIGVTLWEKIAVVAGVIGSIAAILCPIWVWYTS